MIAGIGALVLVTRHGGHAATDRLEQERYDVAGDEDARVREGFDVRILRAEGYDDARESEVDAGCQERWGDGQANDLHQETVLYRRYQHRLGGSSWAIVD